MSVNTSNAYGRISVSDDTIAKVAAHACLESYGVVDTASVKLTATLVDFFKKNNEGRGVSVSSVGNRLYIDVAVVVKYGVSINAVAESLKETIKYKVERFTGMIVDEVNVTVTGVKL